MPEPASGQTRIAASVDDALRHLATKEVWHFEDLLDWIRNASLLRRLSWEGFILGRNNHDLKTAAYLESLVTSSSPQFPPQFAVPDVEPDRWVSPRDWDWVRCVKRVLTSTAIGPDITLSNKGRIRSEDLRQRQEKAAGGKRKPGRKPKKRPTRTDLAVRRMIDSGDVERYARRWKNELLPRYANQLPKRMGAGALRKAVEREEDRRAADNK